MFGEKDYSEVSWYASEAFLFVEGIDYLWFRANIAVINYE
jgi:hypothetical protein